MKNIALICTTFLLLFSCKKEPNTSANINKSLVYKDANAAIETRVDDLLSRMTLDEKIGQMTQICQSTITLDGTKSLNLKVDGIRDLIMTYHIGSVLSGTGKAEKWANFITEMQKIAMNETRLGIPIIYGMDHVHGADYVDDATIFAHNLTTSCSFNTHLASETGRITAIESADLGHVWNFAPVLDIGKNPFWPRLYETFGEDPYTCGAFGSAFIKGYQECKEIAPYKVAACAKHFIGYSDPKSGWDRTPSEIPTQVLYEQFVPSFRMAFKAGVKTLMVNSGELNGEPVHGSKWVLTDLLRDQLKFEGVVLTDIKDIMKIVEMHGGAHNEKEATLMSINAGIDMYMSCNTTDFCNYMKEFVRDGDLTESRIDESVKRILKLKFELGLFENPYPRTDRLVEIGKAQHKQIATDAVKESLVLLKNENNILPLSPNEKILVAGMASNTKYHLNGPWSFEWMGTDDEARHPKDMNTIFTAMVKEFGEANVSWADSANKLDSKFHSDYLRKLKSANTVVLAIGETPTSEFKGDILDLYLPDNQAEIIKKAKEAGKKVVLLIVAGRPLILSKIEKYADAIIFVGYPGFGGGDAIASILSGKTNPSGKLSFTYPNAIAHTVPYYYKKSEYHHKEGRANLANFFNPWEFGYGLSYTHYEYSDLTISDTLISDLNKEIKVSVTVKNIGSVDGKEAVLWFLQDEVGTLTRPQRILKYFEKKEIKAGESATYNFTIQPDTHFMYPDKNGNPIIEDGYFKVKVGGLEKRIRLKRK